jgi:hypothetical protein
VAVAVAVWQCDGGWVAVALWQWQCGSGSGGWLWAVLWSLNEDNRSSIDRDMA